MFQFFFLWSLRPGTCVTYYLFLWHYIFNFYTCFLCLILLYGYSKYCTLKGCFLNGTFSTSSMRYFKLPLDFPIKIHYFFLLLLLCYSDRLPYINVLESFDFVSPNYANYTDVRACMPCQTSLHGNTTPLHCSHMTSTLSTADDNCKTKTKKLNLWATALTG